MKYSFFSVTSDDYLYWENFYNKRIERMKITSTPVTVHTVVKNISEVLEVKAVKVTASDIQCKWYFRLVHPSKHHLIMHFIIHIINIIHNAQSILRCNILDYELKSKAFCWTYFHETLILFKWISLIGSPFLF